MNSDLNSTKNSALHQAACPMSRPHWMSRHRFLPLAEQARSRPHWMSRPQDQQAGRDVNPCRDLLVDKPTSRHQPHVATPIPNRPGRDVKMMSRPPTLSPMSRRQNDVATSSHLSLISATSRRHVATSLAATHVATS